jgi:hypothetical protein
MLVEPAATAAKIPAAMERAANAGGTLTRMAEAAPGAAMETMVIMVIPEISRPAARRKGFLYQGSFSMTLGIRLTLSNYSPSAQNCRTHPARPSKN